MILAAFLTHLLVQQTLDPKTAERFATLALTCVHQEYPNKISHVLSSDADAKPPRILTPAFYGCFDWHSSVHGHWLLARVARLFPGQPFAAQARQALAQSLTAKNIEAEVAYMKAAGRVAFERPYGLVWLLTLVSELDGWAAKDKDVEVQKWRNTLGPLEQLAVERLRQWLPKMPGPVRGGEHEQTAFALGLLWDYAQTVHNSALAELVTGRARHYYSRDQRCPLNYEPSGQDFLSPCLGEADLMRRVMPSAEFGVWLGRFLPEIPLDGSTVWLEPGVVSDRSDPKLAHLDGLNLSRAWMLTGIANGLVTQDPRRKSLLATASAHRAVALPAITGEHYEGGHWLGTFAVYGTR